MSQDRIFAESEADRWFARNQAVLTSVRDSQDPVIQLIDLFGIQPVRALEIGASNGYRLHLLQQRFGCSAVAVEPSQQAIEDGQQRYPGISFFRSTASNIPIAEDSTFDLVIVHFVLHWIDRATLLRSVAEIDRMVKDDGILIIGDFFPAHPERVAYHHLPDADVWTYKQSYANIFCASCLYEQVAWCSFDHASHMISVTVAPSDRMGIAILRKSLHGQYISRTTPHSR